MKGFLFWLRVAVSAVLAAFLVLAPPRLNEALEHNYYREWLTGEREDWSGVLSMWHIVSFKPAQGSVTAYLDSVAAKYEKAHKGVYIEVVGLSPEMARERLSRGERPQLWSFPADGLDAAELAPLSFALPRFAGDLAPVEKDEQAVAAPYLFSGYFLLGNTVLVQELGLAWPEKEDADTVREALSAALSAKSTARYGALAAPQKLMERYGLSGKTAQDGDFKAGQVPFMIGDARAYGDLTRKMASGGFTFDAMPLGPFTDLVQYAGVDSSAQGGYLEHAQGFLQLLLSDASQAKLSALGALPAVYSQEDLLYADSMLQRLYAAYRVPVTR